LMVPLSLGFGSSCCGLWAQPTRLIPRTVTRPNNRRCSMLLSPG